MTHIIQGVPGGRVNILRGHSIRHPKQKVVRVCTCVLFWTVSEIQPFHCTVPKLWVRKISRTVSNTGIIVQVIKLAQLTCIIHFRKFHRQHQCNLQLVWGRHTAYWASVRMYGIFLNISTMSLSTVTTANWRFTPIHMRETRTMLNAISELRYGEIAPSRKPFV
jgi:hypothetical protein